MRKIHDDLVRLVTYNYPPQRMISFDPAITETLFYLGLEKEVVGRTRFCVHPSGQVENAVNVGGTKDMKLERIHELKPDLIIAEKEENTKDMVETLEKHYPVYVFEVQTVDDGLRMIDKLGQLTDQGTAANALHSDITAQFTHLPKANGKRIAYLIWKKPYMAVGRDTYINHLLENLGFVNPFAVSSDRYPIVTESDLQEAKLDYLFLSSEPYPFRTKHHDEFSAFLPDVQPVNIDGEMFWYGARMLQAAKYFQHFMKNL